MISNTRPPVHESLSIVSNEDIYRNEDWWKSVVRYQYDENDDHEEVAVYLWHNNDGWTRKNKYVIKTLEAWNTDKTIIDRLFADSTSSNASTEDFPVSDYYELDEGETVFQSDDWWKAILKISQKGSYETEEVMVYLWQEVDGEWRRRQKYTLKSRERWVEEADAIESILDIDVDAETGSDNDGEQESSETDDNHSMPEEFEQLSREMDKHLSGTLN